MIGNLRDFDVVCIDGSIGIEIKNLSGVKCGINEVSVLKVRR